jgi:hypothetical protein
MKSFVTLIMSVFMFTGVSLVSLTGMSLVSSIDAAAKYKLQEKCPAGQRYIKMPFGGKGKCIGPASKPKPASGGSICAKAKSDKSRYCIRKIGFLKKSYKMKCVFATAQVKKYCKSIAIGKPISMGKPISIGKPIYAKPVSFKPQLATCPARPMARPKPGCAWVLQKGTRMIKNATSFKQKGLAKQACPQWTLKCKAIVKHPVCPSRPAPPRGCRYVPDTGAVAVKGRPSFSKRPMVAKSFSKRPMVAKSFSKRPMVAKSFSKRPMLGKRVNLALADSRVAYKPQPNSCPKMKLVCAIDGPKKKICPKVALKPGCHQGPSSVNPQTSCVVTCKQIIRPSPVLNCKADVASFVANCKKTMLAGVIACKEKAAHLKANCRSFLSGMNGGGGQTGASSSRACTGLKAKVRAICAAQPDGHKCRQYGDAVKKKCGN